MNDNIDILRNLKLGMKTMRITYVPKFHDSSRVEIKLDQLIFFLEKAFET